MKVTRGNEAMSAPSLSEYFAISEIKTIIADVIKNLINIIVIGLP
tara:strand:- start:7073 stop:7207 length:135 start_codon:yes stop_codon:yes gene_type:complete